MALDFYNAYIKTISQEPVDYWRELQQEAVNDTWDNTSTVSVIKGQTSVGTYDYGNEDVQLNSLIDAKAGNALGDEYKKIVYKNYFDTQLPPSVIPASQFLVSEAGGISLYKFKTINGEDFLVRTSDRFLGKYYKFDGFTWMITNTNTIVGSCATAVLKRCNNTLKWYDKDGVFHQWACVFSRNLTGTGFDYGSKGVPEVKADAKIQVQRNAETDMITTNQRFIFDKQTFTVEMVDNHISETFMELYISESQIQSNDDLVNNIANRNGEVLPSTNETKLLPEVNKIIQGETQDFTIYKYVDNVKTDDKYSVQVLGAVSGVNYELSVVDGNNFSITNLAQYSKPITIVCTNKLDSEDIISRNILLGGLW